jgi:hypothetical protein
MVAVIPAVLIVAVIPAVLIVVIIAIGGNSSPGCATYGTADNRAVSSTNFIAHGGSKGATYTAADGRVQGVVSGDTTEWDSCKNHGDHQGFGIHIVMLQQRPLLWI